MMYIHEKEMVKKGGYSMIPNDGLKKILFLMAKKGENEVLAVAATQSLSDRFIAKTIYPYVKNVQKKFSICQSCRRGSM